MSTDLTLLGSARAGFGSGGVGWGALDEYAGYVTVPPPLDPLRELFFDDGNTGFFTYFNWNSIYAPGWPGGLRQDTLSYCDAVHAGDNVKAVTRSFITTGTSEEGIVLYISNEGSGPLSIYIDNDKLFTLSSGPGYGELKQYVIDLRVGKDGLGPYMPYGTGGAPSSGPFPATPVFSAGQHTITLLKEVNAGPGDNGSGDRRTYFDGLSVFTRSKTFA